MDRTYIAIMESFEYALNALNAHKSYGKHFNQIEIETLMGEWKKIGEKLEEIKKDGQI